MILNSEMSGQGSNDAVKECGTTMVRKRVGNRISNADHQVSDLGVVGESVEEERESPASTYWYLKSGTQGSSAN